MSDETELTRLFAQEPVLPGDEAFVRRVTGRIAWRRRVALALPAGASALLLLAIWATWPAAYNFSLAAMAGLAILVDGAAAFFTSPAGTIAAAALLLTGALWAWLFERVRGEFF